MLMMWSLFLYPLMWGLKAAKYHQTDYMVKLERMEIVNHNDKYCSNLTCRLVYYNRTYRAVNASGYLLKDLSMNIKVDIQMYKFLSNEYRFFPIHMDINGCRELVRDNFGVKESLQKSVNFNLLCPVKKGFLSTTYGMIDFSNFPPHIPGGRYKAVIKLFDNSNFILELHGYATIEEIKRFNG